MAIVGDPGCCTKSTLGSYEPKEQKKKIKEIESIKFFKRRVEKGFFSIPSVGASKGPSL